MKIINSLLTEEEPQTIRPSFLLKSLPMGNDVTCRLSSADGWLKN